MMDFTIPRLGPATVSSPLGLSRTLGDYIADYVSEESRIIYAVETELGAPIHFRPTEMLEQAGPRELLYFDPATVRAGIVTCGGLCPGLNDVVRALVMALWHRYGVRSIVGIRHGYRGLLPEFGLDTLRLEPEVVRDIHQRGGTILGSSRGHGDRTSVLVDSLQKLGVNMLFPIGGDGTQKGALAMGLEARRRGYDLALVGIPKTIDNDLSFVQKSFGFETAVSEAVRVVTGAHVEAHDAPNGIAIVQVMGRQSGFIAAHTALASNDVNFVLIPEVPFELEGDNGLLRHLADRIQRRHHAVILVAEGAGQELMPESKDVDASGNAKLGDIGLYLRKRVSEYFRSRSIEASLKYIDPSYIIRSTAAIPSDSIYCARLAHNAVHAAMAGKTGLLVSMVNNHYVHVPIEMAVARRNTVDPESALWRDVLEATGQPPLMRN
jgi:6-phosphofructokinase 1